MNNRTRLAIVILVAAASAALGVLVARRLDPPAPPALAQGTAFPSPRALPAVELVDQDGRPFRPADLRGGWTILFFGFTHCPDVCPATLGTLREARRALADLPAADQPSVVLVSVDPQRDTPAVLKQYVAFFDPSFRALTGTPAQVEALTRGLGVAVHVGAPDAGGQYAVDHTSSLFVIAPSGALVALLSSPHSPDGVAADFRRLLEAS